MSSATPTHSAFCALDLLPSTDRNNRALWEDNCYCEIATSTNELRQHLAAWTDLSRDATEANVFLEPFAMLPALEAFPTDSLRVVLIFRNGRTPQTPRQLCGLIPFVVIRDGLLTGCQWQLWGHDYCFLRTPLLRAGCEVESLAAFVDWAAIASDGPALLDLPGCCGDDNFFRAFAEVVSQRSLLVEHVASHSRAMLRRVDDWTILAADAISSHNRRELRRQWRRLGDLGQIEIRSLEHERELFHWTESFLSLESQGWKGDGGTALSKDPIAEAYFREVLTVACENQRLQMMAIHLNGEPIAMKVNLLAAPGSFAFKIAYDERHAKFSPGVHLEIENMRSFHESTSLQWMDSCAAPRHPMINRLWTERRLIQHVRVSTGNIRGNLTIGTRSLLRSIRRSMR
ncbi:MAG: GNAT family N-acetyltransferase [Planctomycetaceae bacterium]